ncbi:MAG: 1-deoxy-D-xylulose-5-phosphate synthase [Bacteroidetes bacterium]|nr:1-deoxy-D-xylulose-5-phosphate synthase [Bacteroidota bacterium]MCW5896298.1 1-deoxy-D-xylulose-5-phosphate synthase [Bacteroidota bacterium]
MTEHTYPMLDRVNVPSDFRMFSVPELKTLADDVRQFLIDIISTTGGHLGAGLGSVELTVALHHVFNTPHDKLVWDVGHQAYPHKILTGRKDRLNTIRQYKGLSGFLKRTESEYDTFGAGHASTAISAALGMVAARDFNHEDYKVVAIVGDGSMTGGMVYEGMNNAGILKKNLIVVLNDNNMSIAPNVWALSNYFTQLIANPSYNRFKANMYELTGKLDAWGDRLRRVAARLEEGVKVVITPGMLFEALGFRYFGPINGHNMSQLVSIFSDVKHYPGPILVHVTTQKGKGYKPAEADVQRLHGVTPFDKVTGISPKKTEGPPAYTKVFGRAVVELAKQNPRLVGITAAMPDGTGLDQLQKELPDRFYDVGIAEQHGITFAAGLATQGCVPVAAIYSTFLQRAFDQIIHDVALQHLHVVFALDRGGLVGADGPTHHGVFDLSYLRLIPEMVIMAPKDESELRDMLFTAVEYKQGPIALRYPRGNGVGVPLKQGFNLIPIGKGEMLRPGKNVAILCIGAVVQNALKAAALLEKSGIDAEVINMRFVKPIDVELLKEIAGRFDHVVTVEDNSVVGGFGSAVAECYAQLGILNVKMKMHGIPDHFIDHGTPDELHRDVKLDAQGIAAVVGEFLQAHATVVRQPLRASVN